VTSDLDFKVTTFLDIEYQKRHEIEPYLVQNVNRKSYALYRMVLFPMILTDPNPVFKVMAFLKSNISKTVHFRDNGMVY